MAGEYQVMTSIRWPKIAWPLLAGLLMMSSLHAEVALQLGRIEAPAWQADGIRLSLGDAAPGQYALQLRVERLNLPDGPWRDLRLECPALSLDDGYRCDAATLHAEGPHGAQRLSGRFHYHDAEHWQAEFDGLRLAGTAWRVAGRADGDWRLTLSGRRAALAGLLSLLPSAALPAWGWHGRIDAELQVRGHGAKATAVNASLALSDGAYSSPDGLQAAEGLAGGITLQARLVGRAWQGQGELRARAGQGYSDPAFVDFAAHPLGLRVAGGWQPEQGRAVLTRLEGSLGSLLRVEGAGELRPGRQPEGHLQLALPDLAAVYPVLVQPFAYGGPFGRMDLSGTAQLEIDWGAGGAGAVRLGLQDVHLDDQGGRFGLSGLTGAVVWREAAAAGEAEASRLAWQGGHLYQVSFGASEVQLALAGDRLRLLQPLSLPLLDGRLRIPTLEASGIGGEHPSWRAALAADVLSLPQLTAALGWPALAGELSVEIPAVRYDDHVLVLDGELLAQAFDGTVRVSGLSLREPLGAVPILNAEASLRGLDLERLTRVFDFGRITGRLDGDVRGLQLVGWQPVAFHAVLQTPEGDDSTHRIDQRAVDNLTRLGNRGAVALSGTFLQFFESFRYDRLMLKVRLAGQVAELDGIAHPSGGYYLVKGTGLPRIDVIGRNRKVAWRDLVERLRRIRLEGAQMR